MNFHMIFTGYLNDDRKTRSVGGVQTYFYNLSKIIKNMGETPIIYYANDKTDGLVSETYYEDVKVVTLNCPKSEVSNKAIPLIPKNEVVIFGSEELALPYNGRVISIQHGISWDKPELSNHNIGFVWRRALRAYRLLKKIELAEEVVCVDCNFINWYRTQVAYQNKIFTYIPNFSAIAKKVKKSDEVIHIIFARRYEEFRGTKVFASAIEEVLDMRENIDVTFAGEGTDEKFLREKFLKNNRVHFTKYNSGDSLKIHSDMHIAVIPTIGSEGTSLSLLEAMSAQCAVVCTNVGGMTNIVLDHHNGLLVSSANVEELKGAILKLIDDKTLREKLAENGYHTVEDSFSLSMWSERWKNVLERYI